MAIPLYFSPLCKSRYIVHALETFLVFDFRPLSVEFFLCFHLINFSFFFNYEMIKKTTLKFSILYFYLPKIYFFTSIID